MPELSVMVIGRGRVNVAAFGVADAEHLIEKEISRALPGASVAIVGVRRTAEGGIVEEFEVEYRITVEMVVEAEDAKKAAGAAFRRARQLLSGTRYQRTGWDELNPPAS